LPSLLPKGSDIEVMLNIDASRRGKVSIYIPLLDENFDMVIDETIEKDIKTSELCDEIYQARQVAQNLANEGQHDAHKSIKLLDDAQQLLDSRGQERSTKDKVREDLRKIWIDLDTQQAQGEWPKAQQDLQQAFNSLA
jgi:molecular chaperone DnaK